MDTEKEPIALRCPRCAAEAARQLLASRTVLTVTCTACSHAWALPIENLPANIRATLPWRD